VSSVTNNSAESSRRDAGAGSSRRIVSSRSVSGSISPILTGARRISALFFG
jgi:hypothetical protein